MVHDNNLQLTRNSPGPAPARCPGSPCHCWEEGMAAIGSRTPCGKNKVQLWRPKRKNIHMADFTFGCLNQIEHHSVTNTCKLCKFIQINPKCIYLPLASLSHIVDPRVWEQTWRDCVNEDQLGRGAGPGEGGQTIFPGEGKDGQETRSDEGRLFMNTN